MREISNEVSPEPFRYTAESLLAIQEATEDFLVHLLRTVIFAQSIMKRVTIMPKDLQLADESGDRSMVCLPGVSAY